MSCFPPAMRPQPLLTMHFGRQPSRLLHPARFLSQSGPQSSPPALEVELASAPINTPARRRPLLRTTFHDVPLQVLFLALSAYLSENTNTAFVYGSRMPVSLPRDSSSRAATARRELLQINYPRTSPSVPCVRGLPVCAYRRDATFKLAGAVE